MKTMRLLTICTVLGLAIAGPASGDPNRPEYMATPQCAATVKGQQGDLKVRKLPGRTKYGNITLKRGYIAPAKIAEWRRSLRPLLRRPDTRRMSRRDAASAMATNRQARELDILLHRWQRSAMHYEQLKAQRDAAARRGQDTVLLDSRMDDALKEIHIIQETVRNKRQMASTAYQNFDQKANQLYNLMAAITKTMNDSRRGTLRKMQ